MTWSGSSFATFSDSVILYKILFIGNVATQAKNIPSNPEQEPIINVSVLNTLVISFFLAPKACKMPISFVLLLYLNLAHCLLLIL